MTNNQMGKKLGAIVLALLMAVSTVPATTVSVFAEPQNAVVQRGDGEQPGGEQPGGEQPGGEQPGGEQPETEKWTVTFNSNGGSTVAAQEINDGEKATKPEDPTRSGFIFDGWYNGSKKYDFNSEVKAAVELTAKWIDKDTQYSVTVGRHENGSIVVNEGKYKAGEEVKMTATPNNGYKFKCWSITPSVEATADQFNNQIFGKFEMPAGNVTVNAEFEAVKYHITYHDECDSTVTYKKANPTEFSVISTTSITLNSPTRADGVGFLGWYKTAECKDEDKVTSIDPRKQTGDIVLYAKYNEKQFGVTINNTAGGTVTKDKTQAKKGDVVKIEAKPNAGYYFQEWVINQPKTDFYLDYSNTDAVNQFTMPKAAVSIQAKFVKKNIPVIFERGDAAATGHEKDKPGAVNAGGAATYRLPAANYYTPPTDMEFNYWIVNGKEYPASASVDVSGMSDGENLVCTAVWKDKGDNKFNIVCSPVGAGVTIGGNTTRNANDTFTISAEANKGYKFKKWSSKDEVRFDSEMSPITQCTVLKNILKSGGNTYTVTAEFEALKYNIYYQGVDDGKGGKNYYGNPKTYTIEDAVTLKEATKDGYVFEGWFDQEKDGKKITSIPKGTTEDIVLWARFAPGYEVTLKLEGKGTVTGSGMHKANENVTVTATPDLNNIFKGWYQGSQLVSTSASLTFKLEKDITLKAKFEEMPTTATSETETTATEPTKSTEATQPTTPVTPDKPVVPAKPVESGRISGDNRCDTAVEIAKATFDKAENVVIASGDNYADALAGAPLAYALKAPILLTTGGKLADTTADEIVALGAKKVYILGGAAAVNEDVQAEIEKTGCSVERIFGEDRFETAVAIARKMDEINGKAKEYFFASAANYPDALAISSIAALKGAPILYIGQNGKLSDSTDSYLVLGEGKYATILGGTAAIGSDAEAEIKEAMGVDAMRIAGEDRYDTNAQINEKYESLLNGGTLCVATGRNYPDALAGGVLAAMNKAPIMLVNGQADSLTQEQQNYVVFGDFENVCILGGSNAVSEGIESQLVK